MNVDYKKRANRDYSEMWRAILNSMTNRKARDTAFLIAHDCLPTKDMLKRRNVTRDDKCQLCGTESETVKHLFINCQEIRYLKEALEEIICPNAGKTLSEEEIIYHVGHIKMKKKANELIAIYKHAIWTTRALLYYGEICRQDLRETMTAIFRQKTK